MPPVAPPTKAGVQVLANQIANLFSVLCSPQAPDIEFDTSSRSWSIHLQLSNDGKTFDITKVTPGNGKLTFTIAATNKVRAKDIAPQWTPSTANVYTGSVPLRPGVRPDGGTAKYVQDKNNFWFIDLRVAGE